MQIILTYMMHNHNEIFLRIMYFLCTSYTIRLRKYSTKENDFPVCIYTLFQVK
jgi:hypothetical protein